MDDMFEVTSHDNTSSHDLMSIYLPLNRRSSIDNTSDTNMMTILRIKRDLNEFYSSQMTTIHVIPEEDNITRVHALIDGPIGTPYANGFFYFTLQFPSDYPISPPRVKLMTTSRGSVRFNPNLYANGYVCLSILNTWEGPKWSPVLNLTSVLLSIQSLMNEEPYYNEPGREKPSSSSTLTSISSSNVNQISEQYNERIIYETIRVAVMDMIEETNDSKTMPKPLKDIMFQSFVRNFEFYENLIKTKIEKKLVLKPNFEINQTIQSSSSLTLISFDSYDNLMKRLILLKEKFNIQTINDSNNSNIDIKTNNMTTTDASNLTAHATITSYSEIASQYIDKESKQIDLNVEDIISDSDYYMATNDDQESESENEDNDDSNGKDETDNSPID